MEHIEHPEQANTFSQRIIHAIKEVGECTRKVGALLSMNESEFIDGHEVLKKIIGIPKECRAYRINSHLGGNYVIIFFDTDKHTFFSIQVPVVIDTAIQFSEQPKNYSSPFTQDANITAMDANY